MRDLSICAMLPPTMANHVKPLPAPPLEPSRVAYGLERLPGNVWARVRYEIAGDRVVAREDSEPDTFLAQLGRLEGEMRRIVR